MTQEEGEKLSKDFLKQLNVELREYIRIKAKRDKQLKKYKL